MAIFQKKSGGGAGARQATGQGSVNPNYLKECREDNPEPVAQDAAATATLLNCKIDTPPEKLVVNQPFEMSVEATGLMGEIKLPSSLAFPSLARADNATL